MKTTNESKSSSGIIILIGVAFILLLLNMFQLYRTEKVSGRRSPLKIQNDQLRTDLEKAKSDIVKYRGISEKLDSKVKEALNKLLEQEAKIIKLQTSESKLKNENAALSQEILGIKESYIEVIDSLMVSEGLNLVLESTIDALETEIEELNEKIGLASRLKVNNLQVTPLKEKEHGYSKATAMAKKADLIKICFTVQENTLLENEFFDIYVRVLSPDSKILYHEDESHLTIKHPLTGKKVNFSHNEPLRYNAEKLEQCIRWHTPSELKPGVYVVELFTSEYFLGTAAITLK